METEERYIEPLSIKVRKIGKNYHCRLFCLGKVHDEKVCQKKIDISQNCRDMLRWYDKLGYLPYSRWADWSRCNNKLNYRQKYNEV